MKNTISWITIGLILFIILMAVLVFTDYLEAGLTVIIAVVSAVIGALISMFITDQQLKNQSKHGLQVQKNSKVYEERLDVYKNYLNTVGDVLLQKPQRLSDNEILKLEFATALLGLHTNGRNLEFISEKIKNIISNYNRSNAPVISEDLISDLLEIVEQLKNQLYQDEKDNETLKSLVIDEKALRTISNNFNDAYDVEPNLEQSPVTNDSIEKKLPDDRIFKLDKWDKAVDKWKQDGWLIWEGWKSDPNNQAFSVHRGDDKPGEIKTAIRGFRPSIAVRYGDDKDFATEIIMNPPTFVKNSKKQSWLWWTDDDIIGEKDHLAEEMERNENLQAFLIELVEDGIQRIKKWDNKIKMND
ncbi:MAG: phage holin family protein [Muribaculaceae bacterium]|nr:phage holin family protein [Muribaculaceae bacterium]